MVRQRNISHVQYEARSRRRRRRNDALLDWINMKSRERLFFLSLIGVRWLCICISFVLTRQTSARLPLVLVLLLLSFLFLSRLSFSFSVSDSLTCILLFFFLHHYFVFFRLRFLHLVRSVNPQELSMIAAKVSLFEERTRPGRRQNNTKR
jgi:hypothetical protein